MSKLFVVRDIMGPDCTLSDVMMEFTTSEHARYILGCGLARYDQERHEVHLSREDAVADVLRRVEKIGRAAGKIETELRGPTPANRKEILLRLVAAETPREDLWAALRAKTDLAAVMAMVRKDIKAAGNSPGLEAICENLVDGIVRNEIR